MKILDQIIIFYLNLGIKYELTTFSQKLSKGSNSSLLLVGSFCVHSFLSGGCVRVCQTVHFLQKGLALSFASAIELNLKGVQFNKWKLTSCLFFTIGTCMFMMLKMFILKSWQKTIQWIVFCQLFHFFGKTIICWHFLKL